MSDMDIFNLEVKMNKVLNDSNKEDLLLLLEEFKREHFPNVLSKSKQFREKYKMDEEVYKLLLLVESVSHAQIEEFKNSAEIIEKLYQKGEQSSDNLILLGEIAFMSDYKLARRIMSHAVKQMEKEGTTDGIKLARGFIVLGEAEENLEKYSRAIKYYKQALTYFPENNKQDTHMILFLHFKIGMIYTAIDQAKEAIEYLEKTIKLTSDNDLHIKINSFVSIAKIYGSKDENEKAFPYIEMALSLLPNSSLINTMVHAEALTEMAFYYFDQSKLAEAVPHYANAIEIYLQLPHMSKRKLGMIYMQYAYCLEHKSPSDTTRAGRNYEYAIEQLEKTNDQELLENALGDVIVFFDQTRNANKKRFYENKFVKATNK